MKVPHMATLPLKLRQLKRWIEVFLTFVSQGNELGYEGPLCDPRHCTGTGSPPSNRCPCPEAATCRLPGSGAAEGLVLKERLGTTKVCGHLVCHPSRSLLGEVGIVIKNAAVFRNEGGQVEAFDAASAAQVQESPVV